MSLVEFLVRLQCTYLLPSMKTRVLFLWWCYSALTQLVHTAQVAIPGIVVCNHVNSVAIAIYIQAFAFYFVCVVCVVCVRGVSMCMCVWCVVCVWCVCLCVCGGVSMCMCVCMCVCGVRTCVVCPCVCVPTALEVEKHHPKGGFLQWSMCMEKRGGRKREIESPRGE